MSEKSPALGRGKSISGLEARPLMSGLDNLRMNRDKQIADPEISKEKVEEAQDEGFGDGPNDFLKPEDFATPADTKEKLKNLIEEIQTHTGGAGGEKEPLVREVGGEVPTRLVEERVVPKRRGRLGRLAAAAALAGGLASAPDPTTATESEPRVEQALRAPVAPVEVSKLPDVQTHVQSKKEEPRVAVSRNEASPAEVTKDLNLRELERIQGLEAERFARTVQLDEYNNALRAQEAARISPPAKEPVLKVEYGASPEAFTNAHGVQIDKMQPALFADEKGVVTAYGGGFDERAKLAHAYAASHQGSSVRIEAISKGRAYVGEYSIDLRGITQIVSVAEKNVRPGIFSAIGRIFKKEPKIDPEQFVRKLGS